MNTRTLQRNPLNQPPSLYTENAKDASLRQEHQGHAPRTLCDLMHDGFYLLLLLRNRHTPADADQFAVQMRGFLDDFERSARFLHAAPDDIRAAQYAFCAAVDETILTSDMAIKTIWERAPLQLMLFGDQLAGENFYVELDRVRQRGSIQALEIFYLCLLTGFQGKYLLDSPEKRHYLIATLDKELIHLKGKRAAFAPHWQSPDRIRHLIKAELPMWVIVAVFALLGILAYTGFSWILAQHTHTRLGAYFDVIKLAPKLAHITISLP